MKRILLIFITNFVSINLASIISKSIELGKNELSIEELAKYMIIKAIENGYYHGINVEGIRNSALGLSLENESIMKVLLLTFVKFRIMIIFCLF